MFKKRYFILILSFVFISSCSKTTVKTESKKPPDNFQSKYFELIRRGDDFFKKKHLYGWIKAFENYRKAYKFKKSNSLKKKLFITLSLLILRKKQESIMSDEEEKYLGLLKFNPQTTKYKAIFHLVQKKSGKFLIRNKSMKSIVFSRIKFDKNLFDCENSDLDAYFYLLLLKANYEYEKYSDNLKMFGEKFPRSPLFIYLNGFKTDKIEKRFPNFAEFFVYKGNKLFKEGKSFKALNYFKKAVNMVKNYPRAYIGMASVWFFSYENFTKALFYYEKAFEYDPKNPTSLLGKAVSLQKLRRYDESDAVLDLMLKKQFLYHGEAYYYKAYNSFLRKDFINAEKNIKLSKLYIPDSGEVNFLSGLINIRRRKYKEAKKDFLIAEKDTEFKKCETKYYIGKINHLLFKGKFEKYFENYIFCLKEKLENLNKNYNFLKSKGSLSFDEKMRLKKIKRKISSYKKNKLFYLEDIIKMMDKKGNKRIKKASQNLIKYLKNMGLRIN